MVETALDPLGRELTAEEYDLLYGTSYKEDGNFPICKACGGHLFVVAIANDDIDTHYQHPVDADCPDRKRDPFSRSIQPRDHDPEHGRRILKAFCQPDNLKKVYNTLRNIVTQLSTEEFYQICKASHRRRIWRYAGITLEALPYIMALMKDVTCSRKHQDADASGSRTYIVRATLVKSGKLGIDSVWEAPGTRQMRLSFVNDDGTVEEMEKSPVFIPDKRYEQGKHSDTGWIDGKPHLIRGIRKFCREQGCCHDQPRSFSVSSWHRASAKP